MRIAGNLILVTFSLLVVACGPAKRGDDDDDGIPDAPPADAPCPTSVSGKVFAPNGTLPLYNVTVYVPQNPPGPLPEGLQCAQCSTSLPGGAWAQAKTDYEGKFKLENVPDGTDIPIVITTGKWRRQLTIPFVAKCVDTPVMDGVLRLPRNRTEGDIPRIAMVTGGCDKLACIFSKMGIDAAEFGTDPNSSQRIIFYNATGGTAPAGAQSAPTTVWANLTELSKYDMLINSCECSTYHTGTGANKTAPDVLRQYADMGGRIFGSHYHYTWMKDLIPQWQNTAQYITSSTSGSTVNVDTTHPDGQSFGKWLMAVGASSTPNTLTLSSGPQPSEMGVNSPTLRWLYADPYSHYISFKTPVGTPPEMQCGKVVHAGIHVSESSQVNASFPSGCTAQLTPDEKAMIFLLFDLGSCVDVIF